MPFDAVAALGHIDFALAGAGLVVGFVIGLTGMGGGALLTPVLVLLFGVPPATAVSSDIVASLVLKPIGGGVHYRHGTVNAGLVRWLAAGSVPAALAGVFTITHFPGDVQAIVRTALGVTLLTASVAMVAKAVLQSGRGAPLPGAAVRTHRLRTLAIGVGGGFIVGLTSVGSGSLMIVLMMLVYPRISMRELVGTDLVQAIPLVASATLGVFFWGDPHAGVIGSLLLGAVPAVYAGARLSSRANDSIIRPVLAFVMSMSALKLLDVSNPILGALVPLGLLALSVSWWKARGRARAAATWRFSRESEPARRNLPSESHS